MDLSLLAINNYLMLAIRALLQEILRKTTQKKSATLLRRSFDSLWYV